MLYQQSDGLSQSYFNKQSSDQNVDTAVCSWVETYV